jgi:hypothetical protein
MDTDFAESVLFNVYAPNTLGVGQRTTASNGRDDGTMDRSAACFWRPLRHGHVDAAVNNLLGHTTERVANVDGHGNTGLIETGAGQHGPWLPGTYVTSWNERYWAPALGRLRTQNFSLLVLWGCHTGEGDDGADLLFAMARIVGFPVQATNGFVYTNGRSVWIETNAVWVTALPTLRPTPIRAPTPHSLLYKQDRDILVLVAHGQPYTTNISVVHAARVVLRRALGPPREAINLPTDVAQDIAACVFGSMPFPVPGMPTGLITAEIEFILAIDNRETSISILVYNDRLCVNTKESTAYYPSAALVAMLSNLGG